MESKLEIMLVAYTHYVYMYIIQLHFLHRCIEIEIECFRVAVKLWAINKETTRTPPRLQRLNMSLAYVVCVCVLLFCVTFSKYKERNEDTHAGQLHQTIVTNITYHFSFSFSSLRSNWKSMLLLLSSCAPIEREWNGKNNIKKKKTDSKSVTSDRNKNKHVFKLVLVCD